MQETTIAKGAKQFDKATPIVHRQQKLDRMQYQSRFITLQLTKYGEILKLHYGSHSNVARIMGITPRQYQKIRSGDCQLSDMVKNFMTLLARMIANKHRSVELKRLIPKMPPPPKKEDKKTLRSKTGR